MKHSGALRIGYLVQQFPPEVGAGPARVAEMAAHWRDAGADVTVITGMPNRPQGRIHADYRGKLFLEEEHEGIRVLRSWLYASPKHGFARTIVNNLSFMATGFIHALVSRGSFDVLIASSPPFFPHISGALVGIVRRVPVILEVRDLWPDYLVDMGVLRGKLAPRALFALERRLLRSADHVVVVTDSFRRRIASKGVDPGQITVIPNGTDAGFYYAADEPRPVPVPDGSGGEPPFVVGYLGNFGAGQELSTIVEAAAKVQATHRNIRFLLVGDGPQRERIEERMRELRVTNLSIQPPISKSQTRAFHGGCDVSLVPLAPVPVFQETVPSKIFEIMACERPVLASVAGEAARIVEESGGGIVVPPGDAAAIAGGVVGLHAASVSERAEMGRRGRDYVIENYDRAALAERYLEVIVRTAGFDASRLRWRAAAEPVHGSASAGAPPRGAR